MLAGSGTDDESCKFVRYSCGVLGPTEANARVITKLNVCNPALQADTDVPGATNNIVRIHEGSKVKALLDHVVRKTENVPASVLF